MRAWTQRWQRPNWFALLIAEYSTCNLGHFAVMAILSLYFVGSLHLPPAQAGGLLLFVSLSFRLSRIFLAPVIDRFPVHQATFMALFLTGFSYLGMSVAKTPILVMALLLSAGIGHGTNSLLVKTLAAHSTNSKKSEVKLLFFRYASLTTGINIAAAVGAFAGSTLLFHWSASVVFLLAATAYILAGLIAMCLPSNQLEEQQRPKWGAGLKLSLRRLPLWRAMLFAFMGWFLYTQSYASLPLFVSDAVHRPDLLGSVFALNAILVVIGQVPLSRLIIRLHVSILQIIILAFLAFAGGFALLWFFPIWQIVYAAVALWTLGEILLMPALDTLVADGALAEHKQVAFTLNAAAVSLGEGIGNFIGVSGAESLLNSGNLHYLYTFFTLGAISAMVMTVFINRKETLLRKREGEQTPVTESRA
ncbi:MAG TPA: MFS transporter [Ktedonobacteraceae bacterium]|nr:MFS transporter [Ktedonobacteraceae bacterium]